MQNPNELTDEELLTVSDDPALRAKLTPQEMGRLSQLRAARGAQPADDRGILNKAADAVLDTGIGAAKGLGNTVFGLGKIVRDYTPVGRISDAILPGAFDQKPPEIVPQGTAQNIGYGAEQLGEFFVPTGAVGKVGKAAEVAKSGALTLAQSGSPASAGVSAAITAAIPGGGVAKKAAGALEAGAEKTMAQSLGATKEWAKSEAATLAPEMLKRGVKGSRDAMLAEAKAKTADVGQKIGQEYASAAGQGATVSGDAVRAELEKAAEKIATTDAAGAAVPIEGTQRVAQKLAKLDKFVESLGPDIPVDKAAKVKQTWDAIVSKSGLYGPKATASATDNADAWAVREGSGAFRELLNANPTIEALNKEYAFWKGLKGVLKETTRRTQAQGGGLVSAGMGGAGAVVGALSGDTASERTANAVIGGLAGRQLIKVIQSPAWRTTITGPMKQKLADALASGEAARIESAVGRIVAAAPSELRQATAQ